MDRKEEIVRLLRENAAQLRQDKDYYRRKLGITFGELFDCGDALEYSKNGPNGPYFKPTENPDVIRWMKLGKLTFHVRAAAPDASSPAKDDDADATAPRPCAHSKDYRSVRWHDREYSFTGPQAAIVKLLWEAHENGTPEVGDATLLETVDSKTSRLVDIFRNNKAWGDMIVQGSTRGTRRLAPPPNNS